MKIRAFVVILVTAACVWAQATLTNKDIVEMSTAGLSETIIIAKIKASAHEFTTDAASLKVLTEAKVPEGVMLEMIRISETGKTVGETMPATPVQEPTQPAIRATAAPFTPYRQLSKDDQKRRLKTQPYVDIAAPASKILQIFVRAFQSEGYQVEESTTTSLRVTKDVKGVGAALLAGMAGSSNVQWLANVNISEMNGVCHVTLGAWITMQNAFGKQSRQDASETAKNRIALDNLLSGVKQTAEGSQ